jgi:hypothetical protein
MEAREELTPEEVLGLLRKQAATMVNWIEVLSGLLEADNRPPLERISDEPASRAQLRYMDFLRIRYPQEITMRQASEMIRKKLEAKGR